MPNRFSSMSAFLPHEGSAPLDWGVPRTPIRNWLLAVGAAHAFAFVQRGAGVGKGRATAATLLRGGTQPATRNVTTTRAAKVTGRFGRRPTRNRNERIR